MSKSLLETPSLQLRRISAEKLILGRTFRVLANKTRLNMLGILSEEEGGKTARELSHALSIRESSCRYHLKLLLRFRYVEESIRINKTSGRLETVYKSAHDLKYIDYPPRRYLALVQGLSAYLKPIVGESVFKDLVSQMGESIGIETAMNLKINSDIANFSIPIFLEIFVKNYLKSIGTEPVIQSMKTDSAVFRIRNCPYREVAFIDPEAFCDALEFGFHKGVCKEIKGVSIRRMKCEAKGDCSCEFAVEAKPATE